jgi:hypothetical protein
MGGAKKFSVFLQDAENDRLISKIFNIKHLAISPECPFSVSYRRDVATRTTLPCPIAVLNEIWELKSAQFWRSELLSIPIWLVNGRSIYKNHSLPTLANVGLFA